MTAEVLDELSGLSALLTKLDDSSSMMAPVSIFDYFSVMLSVGD